MEQLTPQGSGVVEIREKINSWAASHEEKWGRVTTKPEEKVQVHKERQRRGLHITILMDGGEGKILRKGCVVKGIDHQREKREKMKGQQTMKDFTHLCQ